MAVVRFHRLAARELNSTARFYEAASKGLGARFLDAVESCVAQVTEFPASGEVATAEIRRKLVRGFPFAVVYRQLPDEIRILAIMNLKRRPMYWVERE